MKLLHQRNHQVQFFKSASFDYPIHLHNALEMVIVTGGSSYVLYNGSRIRLAAGDIFVCFPNRIHGYENSADVQGYVLIIPVNPYLNAFSGILEQKCPADPLLRRGQWEHTSLLELLNMAYREKDQASKAVMQGYFLVIVGKLLSLLTLVDTPAGNADVLQAVLLFINDHYTQPVTRKSIARAVGCNESYISHVFSDTFRTTLTDYITALRIGDALELLTNTTQPVSQIALSLGFGSIRSFNRVFQKQLHMTPSVYRKAAKLK